MNATTFGCQLRELRLAHDITLRDFAKRLGVTPTYVSQIEQEYCKPPKANVVEKMATILGQDVDEFLTLAGRLPEDLCEVIRTHPASMVTFLRSAARLTETQIAEFARQATALQLQNES
ncbi:MAG: helix-turn-helix transcriptional regulator [Rubripirellula sp.]|jgi:DNA-binding XRE family transcriptional regulator|nr:helix-turn-helix transcriptional regulator [Rubripirellula sp.]